MIEMRDNGPEAQSIRERADASVSRSVYLPLLRGVTPRSLEPFDPVEQTLVTGQREVTTVPSQALYLLNAPFVRRQALTLAERLLADKDAADAERIERAYRLAFGRAPTSDEVERVYSFLADFETAYETSEDSKEPIPTEPVPVRAVAVAAPQPANPDEADQSGVTVVEERVRARDARTAAWLAFTQALLGSAEFRYIR
jgi:hypothetical protein